MTFRPRTMQPGVDDEGFVAEVDHCKHNQEVAQRQMRTPFHYLLK